MDQIPFSRPFLTGRELDCLGEALHSRRLAGDGPFTRRCRELLEQRWGFPLVLLTHSCTGALELAALLCDLEPGDEVLLPSFTFTSTANAFLLRGATLRFVDLRPDTLNLDESLLEASLTDRSRVIVPVHYAGVGCAMDAILDLARRRDLRVVEDAAQAFGASYRDRPLGGLGDLGCLSFQESKNIISGEGGALVVNSPQFASRAEIIWQKGTNRAQFFRGEVDKYSWMEPGSAFPLADLLAAVLLPQLEAESEITARRRALWELYHQALAGLEERGCLRRPRVPDSCRHNGHLYYVLTADPAERQALIAHLARRGITAVFHYVPLHTAPAGLRLGCRPGQLPVTEDLADRLLRLPLFADLTEAELARVVEAVEEFYRG